MEIQPIFGLCRIRIHVHSVVVGEFQNQLQEIDKNMVCNNGLFLPIKSISKNDNCPG